jgi:hypothetical protein
MKLGTRVLHKKLRIKHEFRDNRLSDSHALLTGVKEFMPLAAIFPDPFR